MRSNLLVLVLFEIFIMNNMHMYCMILCSSFASAVLFYQTRNLINLFLFNITVIFYESIIYVAVHHVDFRRMPFYVRFNDKV